MPSPATQSTVGTRAKGRPASGGAQKGGPAAATAKKAAAKKAASAVAPEVTAAQYAKQRIQQKRQDRTDARRNARGGQKVTVGGREVPKLKAPGFLSKVQPRKALLAEFVLCFVVLGAGTIVAPSGSQDGVPRMAVKGTGLAALFFILSLVASGGQKSAKIAAGFGALVATAYLFTSSDAANLAKWVGGYYSPAGLGQTIGGGLAGGAGGLAGGLPTEPTGPSGPNRPPGPPQGQPSPPPPPPPWTGVLA